MCLFFSTYLIIYFEVVFIYFFNVFILFILFIYFSAKRFSHINYLFIYVHVYLFICLLVYLNNRAAFTLVSSVNKVSSWPRRVLVSSKCVCVPWLVREGRVSAPGPRL